MDPCSTERSSAASGMVVGMDEPTAICGHTETSNAGRTYICERPPHPGPSTHFLHYMVLAS